MTLSVYIASYGTMNEGLEKILMSHGLIVVMPSLVLGGTEETHKKVSPINQPIQPYNA
jgi:hypothetical protein